MRKVRRKEEVLLEFYVGRPHAEAGFFEGGAVEPSGIDEVEIWIDKDVRFNFDRDEFEETGAFLVNIMGTSRGLYDLGKFLIACALFETEDPNYHQHIDELKPHKNHPPCNLIVRRLSEQNE